ncbi:hypothetical protein [Reyranella sp. CPCC 100927]|uniref:hypothetical protein n=1 Tax=Reyranella sp. CPCC 100927 TaxID=2599616 RepID=UPI0011B83FE3|nr:hypothetical protein [Reyranella sp. CPCC 100927]TWT09556.1 hypothetical protein FQU96_20505 [Reyranella sp. CPCC 100927]
MRRFLKRFLTPPLALIAALLVLLEETLIAWLQRLMASLARLPWVAAIEARAARLPPYPAMILFLLPAAILFPIKLAALWMITQGHFLLGAAIIFAGKVVGTAFAARVYKVLHPTLATLGWFVRAEAWVFAWRDWLYAFVRALPAWQAAAAMIHRLRRLLARPGWVSRRFAAMRRRYRRSA